MSTACGLCGNQEGDFVAIGLIDDNVVYLCRHGHIDATTYDIETGLIANLTLGDNEMDEDVYLLLAGDPDSLCEFDGLGEIIDG